MKLDLAVYRGYANQQEIRVFGHVFKKNAPNKYAVDKKQKVRHAYSVIKMFTIKTLTNITVKFKFRDLTLTTATEKDGYFEFIVPYSFNLESGWHFFDILIEYNGQVYKETAEFIKPFSGKYGFISDIDDTFLISHSGDLLKKLYVMLSRNVARRKVFEGVVKHYELLNKSGLEDDKHSNAFFYVSSSEWNLYHFISRFTRLHNFPKAVLKLKKIKSGLFDFMSSGGGDHRHKFLKIKHLIEFYPELSFVLLGDDSQQDPFIYEEIAQIYPKNLTAIYIRKTQKEAKDNIAKLMHEIQNAGVSTCYFKDSQTAIEHSKSIDLI